MVIIGAANERQSNVLDRVGLILGADKIEYIDRGNGETYNIIKNGVTIQIRVSSNKVDGGYAYFEIMS